MAGKIVEIRGVNKFFATSQALCEVDLDIAPGECVGLVGHNGAGKSTLMNILAGIFPPDSGSFVIDGRPQGTDYDVYAANRQGVRTVFQELSLCLNLSVIENMRVFHPEFRGIGWAGRATDTIMSTLSAVFPNHRLRPGDLVGNMTLGQRQTLEIAKAFAENQINPLRLLILDEPTSALDYHTARQLLNHIVQSKGRDVAFIYISHILEEVQFCADRIVVMKDGHISGQVESRDVARDYLITLMGGAEATRELHGQTQARKDRRLENAEALICPRLAGDEPHISLKAGEIIGLAGLAGHGQTELLIDLFTRKSSGYKVNAPVTFVPGDRQRDGVFPLWSILYNLTFQIYDRIRRLWRLIDIAQEKKIGERWKEAVDLKSGDLKDNILSLSGGNQQKILFARCLESDAQVVLMDDPTRGVDVGTKEIIYQLIFAESAKGRGFVWYTTEMDEFQYCDRVYIFKGGRILSEMPGESASEEAILKASF